MLENCTFQGKLLTFSTTDLIPDANIFTTIVGKNGTGKSRLLKSIVESFVEVKEPASRQQSLNYPKEKTSNFKLKFRNHPKTIIALSTSPFDKFPITRETSHIDGYEYLGLRGLNSQNLSLSFISRILGALLRSITENPEQAKTVANALNYLGYEGIIEARLVPDISPRIIENITNSLDLYDTLKTINQTRASPFLYRLADTLRGDSLNITPQKIIAALKEWQQQNNKPRLNISIDPQGAYNSTHNRNIDENILLLYDIGFFRLRDVGLQKKFANEKIRITDASSGEQCVVMAILGIASHIKNGSLICIDEPEICLHPEWQEKYIELLMATFGAFSNCHFLIATHSPQIIAKLREENCFVLDLEGGETISAKDTANKSADFQLANIFKAPGYKNEYLSRELISTLATISSSLRLDPKKRREISKLLSLKHLLEDSDPVKKLMDILESSLKEVDAL